MRVAVLGGLLLLVVVSMTNAVALQSASITNYVGMTVTSTDNALISLAPGIGGSNVSNTVQYQDSGTKSALLFDFRQGYNGNTFGFTANSPLYQNRFHYKGLFTVTNQSAMAKCISVFATTGAPADLHQIWMRPYGSLGSGTQVAGSSGAYYGCVTILAGETYEVDFWWQVTSAAPLTGSFNLRVQGTGP